MLRYYKYCNSLQISISYAEYVAHKQQFSATACLIRHNGLLNGFVKFAQGSTTNNVVVNGTVAGSSGVNGINGINGAGFGGDAGGSRHRQASVSPTRQPQHHYFTRESERQLVMQQQVQPSHSSRFLPGLHNPYCPPNS